MHKPMLVPEFYMSPYPRVLYVLRATDGALVNCNNATDAMQALQEECEKYLAFVSEVDRRVSEQPPLWGKSPIEELTISQLQEEIARRIRDGADGTKEPDCPHEKGVNYPDGYRCAACGWLIDTAWRVNQTSD